MVRKVDYTIAPSRDILCVDVKSFFRFRRVRQTPFKSIDCSLGCHESC